MTELSWEELVDKAKDLGYVYNEENEELTNRDYYFYAVGGEIYNGYLDLFARGCSPSQMYQIMLALEDKILSLEDKVNES